VSDTPETDAQLTTYTSISKLKKHFTNKKGTVSAEFARKLELERDNARRMAEGLRSAACEKRGSFKLPWEINE
jgi:hypothetical protein